MKLENEIDNLNKLKKTLEKVLELNFCLEYYKINDYTIKHTQEEIKKINSVLNILISMFDDREYLLTEEND